MKKLVKTITIKIFHDNESGYEVKIGKKIHHWYHGNRANIRDNILPYLIRNDFKYLG
jgi:hypothetical protein